MILIDGTYDELLEIIIARDQAWNTHLLADTNIMCCTFCCLFFFLCLKIVSSFDQGRISNEVLLAAIS